MELRALSPWLLDIVDIIGRGAYWLPDTPEALHSNQCPLAGYLVRTVLHQAGQALYFTRIKQRQRCNHGISKSDQKSSHGEPAHHPMDACYLNKVVGKPQLS